MAAQRQEMATRSFNFVPTTLAEAQEYATIFASSGLCPEAYRGRPNDILIVWQMGKELGLEKMQALRTLGCINGMPFAYGDGLLALVKRHPQFEDMKEWFEGSLQEGTLKAFCMVKRKGKDPVTKDFDITDAKLACLWNKKGTWQMYPKRMLQHRARGFAVKDAFPDAIFGLMSEGNEVQGIVDSTPIVEVAPIKAKGIAALEETLGVATSPVLEGEFIEKEETVTHQEIRGRLLELVVEMNIPEARQERWCKKFGVSAVSDLSEEAMKEIVDVLTQPKEKS